METPHGLARPSCDAAANSNSRHFRLSRCILACRVAVRHHSYRRHHEEVYSFSRHLTQLGGETGQVSHPDIGLSSALALKD